jgi:hypothetical protein
VFFDLKKLDVDTLEKINNIVNDIKTTDVKLIYECYSNSNPTYDELIKLKLKKNERKLFKTKY